MRGYMYSAAAAVHDTTYHPNVDVIVIWGVATGWTKSSFTTWHSTTPINSLNRSVLYVLCRCARGLDMSVMSLFDMSVTA